MILRTAPLTFPATASRRCSFPLSPHLPGWSGGRIGARIRTSWDAALVDELAAFPLGQHDD
jgi:hypothetical protein